MIELISNDAKYWRKCFVTQSRRVHDAWPYLFIYLIVYLFIYLFILIYLFIIPSSYFLRCSFQCMCTVNEQNKHWKKTWTEYLFICVFTYFLNYHSFLFFEVEKTQIKTDMVQVSYQNSYGKVWLVQVDPHPVHNREWKALEWCLKYYDESPFSINSTCYPCM